MKVKNWGETAATDVDFGLTGAGVGDDVLQLLTTESQQVKSNSNTCNNRIDANTECSLYILFTPVGEPYTERTWNAALRVRYQDGRNTQETVVSIEALGGLCARQELGLAFESAAPLESGRLDSDAIEIHQSFRLDDLALDSNELAAVSLRLKLSRNQTRFDQLLVSIHETEGSLPESDYRPPIATAAMDFSAFTRESQSWVQIHSELHESANPWAWYRFELPVPAAISESKNYSFSLKTIGLKNGSVLFGKMDDLDNAGLGYPGGMASIWSLPNHGLPHHSPLPHRDLEFQLEQCAP
jgi:hypothetical protein